MECVASWLASPSCLLPLGWPVLLGGRGHRRGVADASGRNSGLSTFLDFTRAGCPPRPASLPPTFWPGQSQKLHCGPPHGCWDPRLGWSILCCPLGWKWIGCGCGWYWHPHELLVSVTSAYHALLMLQPSRPLVNESYASILACLADPASSHPSVHFVREGLSASVAGVS